MPGFVLDGVVAPGEFAGGIVPLLIELAHASVDSHELVLEKWPDDRHRKGQRLDLPVARRLAEDPGDVVEAPGTSRRGSSSWPRGVTGRPLTLLPTWSASRGPQSCGRSATVTQARRRPSRNGAAVGRASDLDGRGGRRAARWKGNRWWVVGNSFVAAVDLGWVDYLEDGGGEQAAAGKWARAASPLAPSRLSSRKPQLGHRALPRQKYELASSGFPAGSHGG